MCLDLNRKRLNRLFKYFSLLCVTAIFYVLLDFAIDIRPSQIHTSYQFNIGELAVDQPSVLRQDNLSILVIKRSQDTVAALRQAASHLQDPDSRRSNQPGFATNALRSKHEEFFISYAIGTNLGCILEVIESGLREICSEARYDLAGRALQGDNKFQNLVIPDYNFTSNFNTLTITP